MRTRSGAIQAVRRAPLAALVITSVLVSTAVIGLVACESSTGTTAGSVSTTSVSTTREVTVSAPSSGTTVAVATGTSGGTSETTIYNGTTILGSVGQTRALTFLGPATSSMSLALREIVMSSDGDGQKVLDEVAKLTAGPSVDVGSDELDAVSGIGFAAGADTSQPIGAATGDDGRQVVVFAFSVSGKPEKTTIVGFDRRTKLVGLVEGPLPISSSAGNLTTMRSS